MSGLELVGAIAAAITLLGAGVSLGSWRERRRRANESLEGSLRSVRNALSSIELSDLSLEGEGHRLGSQVLLKFKIKSSLDGPIEAWLGADIQIDAGDWFYDTSQDKPIILSPGTHIYSRHLHITEPLEPGSWILTGGVWFGPTSNVEQSFRLARRSLELHLRT